MKKTIITVALLTLVTTVGVCQNTNKTNVAKKGETDKMVQAAVPGQWEGERGYTSKPKDNPTTQYVQKLKPSKSHKAKNVIVIIGDGMGTAQVYASIVAQRGWSNFLRFPFSGFSRTYSNNKYTTDSGAGGTAIVGGRKTNNSFVGMGPDSTQIYSFLHYCLRNGKSTGFVVTSSVIDATPASTYGNVPYRRMYDTLSDQFAHAPFDVMIGGGLHEFLPENRKDGKNPLDTLRNRGYEVTLSVEEMKASESQRLVAITSEPYYSPKASERQNLLVEGVKKALSILTQNKKGFGLMIEGSQIDWACHNNDAPYMEEELADFEQMLAVVLDFAERDGNTLVVVTADHETGGLVLTGGDITTGRNECKYITDKHSGVMVPVFAFGPGAEQFSGIQNNIEILPKILKTLKIKNQ